ncbi:MAG: DUF3426 domain-containing protein [bacterium]
MRTRCPHCETLYELEPSELDATNGLASCFQCRRAFNALENEVEDEQPGLAPVLKSQWTPTSKPTEKGDKKTESSTLHADDWDIVFAEDSSAERPSPATEPASSSEAPEQAPSPSDDWDAPPSKPVSEAEVPPAVSKPKTSGALPGIELDTEAAADNPFLKPPATKKPPQDRWLMATGILLLLLLAVAQLAWLKQDQLLADERFRTLATNLCAHLQCELPVQRAPRQLQVVQRSLQPDPAIDKSLQLQVTLRNEAGYQQPLPLLQLTLLNHRDEILARRMFSADEYQADSTMLAAGELGNLSLHIRDPGWQAAGFRMEFY